VRGRDVLAELRAWRDEFARSHGYDLWAMAAVLREMDAAAGARVVRGEPRRPTGKAPVEPSPPNSSMASKVKLRTIPAEEVFSSSRRYNRNRWTRAFRLHRHFHPEVSVRDCTKQLYGSKPAGPLPGPAGCGAAAAAPRNSCVPHAGQAKRRDHAP
jgi:hypothetical protein